MTSSASQALAFAVQGATQGASPTPISAPVAWLLVALAVLMGALWWRARGQAQDRSREVARLAKAGAQAADKSKSGLQQQLESSRAALKAAEVALAVQKKKNFQHIALLQAAQQEAEEAGRRANATIESAKRAQRDAEAARREPGRTKNLGGTQATAPKPQASAAQIPPAAEAPNPPVAETADLNAEHSAEKRALTEALFAAEASRAMDEAKSLELKEALKEARRQMSRKDKRIEDLRRLDLMSRGKIEVLEDKLKRLGRELYETISTVAQLRGEVGPVPGPKEPKALKAAKVPRPTQPRAQRPTDVPQPAQTAETTDVRPKAGKPERAEHLPHVPAHISAAQTHTPQAPTPSVP